MNYENASLNQIKDLIKSCLRELYQEYGDLFTKNEGRGISERCLVFRFAYYLQNKMDDYFVDCDYNSSFVLYTNRRTGERKVKQRSGKPIVIDGISKKRFIDIIVHKRNDNPNDDFLCLEIKKWNNYPKSNREKDLNNLRVLTTQGVEGYQYLYGFFLLLGKEMSDTKWIIYEGGKVILNSFVFSNQTRLV
jgi:hypothetical protein